MTDLEITKMCAEAMGLQFKADRELWCGANAPLEVWTRGGVYDPLHDDAQAMALVKKFGLELRLSGPSWHVWPQTEDFCIISKNLNEAICAVVAQMQLAKQTA